MLDTIGLHPDDLPDYNHVSGPALSDTDRKAKMDRILEDLNDVKEPFLSRWSTLFIYAATIWALCLVTGYTVKSCSTPKPAGMLQAR